MNGLDNHMKHEISRGVISPLALLMLTDFVRC